MKTQRILWAACALLLCMALPVYAQNGTIRGTVVDATSNETLPSATVEVQGADKATVCDLEGRFEIGGLEPGLYNLVVRFIGFQTKTVFELQVTNSRPAVVEVALEAEETTLGEVVVTADNFAKTDESPVSLRKIGANEIRRAPGGNRDISKVIRALPGVASSVSFRNDIIIRGGAPNENRFYLDGIEIPVINHFQTQGSSGGPVGMINVDFIQDVSVYTGAFPANRGNSLSSVFEFEQREGRDDKWIVNGILGATDVGVTLDGPVNDKSSLIFSARRSYLQFLFEVLGLPFLPTYNDAQFKYTYNFDQQNKLTVLGIGAIDNFELNTGADDTEDQRYILRVLPVNEQWNYTVGAKYERFRKDGFYTFVASRSQLSNTAFKYEDNDESLPKLLDYESGEEENKFRFEDYRNFGQGLTLTYGGNFETARYTNRTFDRRVSAAAGLDPITVDATLDLLKYGLFAQASKELFDGKLVLSAGLRTDWNDYSESMGDPLDQLSPRFSLAYYFTERFSFNFNTGVYYQLPAYTVLGFKPDETFVNKDNGLKYMQNRHLVAGLEYVFNSNTKISVEGFYKRYYDYPFSVTDSVSLANLGADFGVVGNEEVSSTSEGRAYGVELLAQQKLTAGFYGLLAYTFVRSEFQDKHGDYVPSSWDNRHLVSLTGGKRFGRNWEIGLRWLFSGPAPYTPYDLDASLQAERYDVNQAGLPDFERLNEKRSAPAHQLDVRIDKKWFFDKWSFNVFVDVQNLYGYEVSLQDNLGVVRDDNGNPIEDPDRPGFYQPNFLENTAGTVLPTIGVIVEL